jgi:hypothetical protein
MPQDTSFGNTRPRRVTEPELQPTILLDPSMIPPTGDAFAEVTNLLQQLQSQQYQPPQQSTLQTILNALAQGASIAASQDPGAALGNILNQRLQIQQNRENQERQRRQQIQTAMIQASLEKAKAITQRQIATEGRIQEANLRTQEYSNRRQIDLVFDLKARNQEEDWINANLPMIIKRAQLTALAQRYPDLLDKSTSRQIAMRTLIPEMPANIAKELADHYANLSERPLSEEAKIWDEQYATKLGVIAAQDRLLGVEKTKAETEESKAKTKLYESEAKKAAVEATIKPQRNIIEEIFTKSILEKASDGPHRLLQDGTIITNSEYVKLQGTIMGSQSLKGSRPLTAQEEAEYVQKQVMQLKDVQNELNNQPNSPQPGANPATNLSPAEIQANVEQLRKAGKTDQQIRQFMQGKGFTEEQINQYLTPITAPTTTPTPSTQQAPTSIAPTRQVFDSRTGRWITERIEFSRDSAASIIKSIMGYTGPTALNKAYQLFDTIKSQNPKLDNNAIVEKIRSMKKR